MDRGSETQTQVIENEFSRIRVNLIYSNLQPFEDVSRGNLRLLKITNICLILDQTFTNIDGKTPISLPISVIRLTNKTGIKQAKGW